jgi:hypothetical protein
LYQLLINRSLITRSKRVSAGFRIALEARLDGPALSYLWQYVSPPALPLQPEQPFLSNSVLLSVAASAAQLLVTAQQQHLLISSVVLAPPLVLPMHAGQPGNPAPVLLMAMDASRGSCIVEVEGQRQLQCFLGTTTAATEPAEVLRQSPQMASAEEAAVAPPSATSAASSAVFARAQELLGDLMSMSAASAAEVPGQTLGQTPGPAALVAARHRPHHFRTLAAVNSSLVGTSVNASGYVLHPADLEAALQACCLHPEGAGSSALWLSAVHTLSVPLLIGADQHLGCGGHVAADFVLAADGSTCQVSSLHMTSCRDSSDSSTWHVRLSGAVLAADAVAAAEVAAVSAPQVAAVDEGVAAASIVAAATNPLAELDDTERTLFLQAQIMSEVRGTSCPCMSCVASSIASSTRVLFIFSTVAVFALLLCLVQQLLYPYLYMVIKCTCACLDVTLSSSCSNQA